MPIHPTPTTTTTTTTTDCSLSTIYSFSRFTCLRGRPRAFGVQRWVPSLLDSQSLPRGEFSSRVMPLDVWCCVILTTEYRWRWSLWELVWMSAPILVLYLIACPETRGSTILRRRARRLRRTMGRNDLRSQSEIQQADMSVSSIFVDAVIKPVEIMIKDPAVLFTNVYVCCFSPYLPLHLEIRTDLEGRENPLTHDLLICRRL